VVRHTAQRRGTAMWSACGRRRARCGDTRSNPSTAR
jgi:hypothetical protein